MSARLVSGWTAPARLLSMVGPAISTLSASALSVAVLSAAVMAAEPTKLGNGVTLEKVTPIAEVIAQPASFEGKTVRIEGVVKAVCTHMGCWMALAPSADAKETVRLKVDDGVIVFPVSAKGKKASAQGVVERVSKDPEGAEAAAEQAKAEGNKAPSAESAAAQFHIKATGAVIE